MDRLTKIICTLGPSTSTEASVAGLIGAGMDYARLNFSYGSHDEHKDRMDMLRRVSAGKRKVGIIQDLPGPKIRIGSMEGKIKLKEGSTVVLAEDGASGKGEIPVTCKGLARAVSSGGSILMSDGKIRLKVKGTENGSVSCVVEDGGTIKAHNGVSIVGGKLDIGAITEEDMEHMKFGIENGVDYIAISFVTSADDIRLAKSLIAKWGSDIPVIAKVERKAALDNLDGIIEASDAVMVARGDLAIDIGFENLALAQKRIIKRSNELGKPVIAATQFLFSMVRGKVPTRAEATDIANAVIDGSDAIMLSDETAVGRYPQRAVAVLDMIVSRMEEEQDIRRRLSERRNRFYDRFH
ncbi:MAG: pyruvate kinase [Candidatus Micrarchaeota archaeon]|nr:pyruvate kinase [Candidatus Micrarchaeota archaeon]